MFNKITELPSPYRHIEKMPVKEILLHINGEDKTIPDAVAKSITQIENLIKTVVGKMTAGGRLFYIGAGTSGRLGIIDASECPPTFGVGQDSVVGIIAGGDSAVRKSVEFAEDDTRQGWIDLKSYEITAQDFVIGIAASGSTPYVIGALKSCRERSILTGCITCNPGSPITSYVDFPIVVPVGPEFITGSTRMKSGTAQKLVLNMISTTVMIKIGRVKDNKMVNMQLSNEKLFDRAIRMITEETGIKDRKYIRSLLLDCGSVKKAISIINSKKSTA
jgi:N-acetylmuramic acid 6-phosphate etherase